MLNVKMDIKKTAISEVLEIQPKVFDDNRGFFLETYHKERYRANGINYDFVQDNHSRSTKGVLRGLHFQLNRPQGKLVRVVSGEVFDVAVDIRFGSPTFGKAAWTILSSEKKNQFWVPPGFAHGFCVLSTIADFEYKCTDLYDPFDEVAVLWSDIDLNIPWPLDNPLVSVKDSKAMPLNAIEKKYLPRFGK